MISYVGIQVTFWVFANFLLAVIIYFSAGIFEQPFETTTPGGFMLLAIVFGFFYGIFVGVIGYLLDQNIFRKLALGKIILFKTVSSLAILILLLVALRLLVKQSFPNLILERKAWNALFYMMVVYYFFMTIAINFINQVNKKYGPGILLPLLLGRYRNPREEERIFLFMDLTSSTATAEKLGHLKYSAFIRDCFADINQVLMKYHAQVYQYAGDEIIITWPFSEGVRNWNCLKIFYACMAKFNEREDHYLSAYNLVPSFKGGLHGGKVTAVEIGEIKRDIAYHGDTMNTAARVRSVCNEFGKNFLVTESLYKQLGSCDGYRATSHGKMRLKGKSEEIGLCSIELVTF